MRWTRQLFFSVLLLLTLCDASERRVHRKTMLRHTPSRGAASNQTHHTLTMQTEASHSTSLTPGNLTASRFASHQQKREGEQLHIAGPNRRAMPNRRRPQTRTPANRVFTSQEVESQPGVDRALSTPAKGPTGSGSSLNILASFAGKNRVLVITAPHASDGYYRLMMSLLKPDVYCDMAERHMLQVVIFHQEGETGGTVRRVSAKGQVTEEPLDPALVPRLMGFLKLEEGKFFMVLLRKNLQVEERYPYPVRLEAMYEVMDQTPIRKLEKARQRGFLQRCKAAGVEGQVVTSPGPGTTGADIRHGAASEETEKKKAEMPPQVPSTTVAVPTTTQATTTTLTTTRKPTTTTTKPTTTTGRTTKATTTKRTPAKRRRKTTKPPPVTTPAAKLTATTTAAVIATTVAESTTTTLAATSAFPTTSDPHTTPWSRDSVPTTEEDRYAQQIVTEERGLHVEPIPGKEDITPIQDITTSVRTDGGLSEGEGEVGENGLERSVDSLIAVESSSPERDKKVRDNVEIGKKTNKPNRKNKAEKKKRKMAKEDNPNPHGRKSGKKGVLYQEKPDGDGPSGKQAKVASPLTSFFGSFERRRRLLVITTPSEENRMYTQQREEYLENVCEMAVRKLSIITIFGSWSNGTMKIDHYQLERDQPLKGVPREDLTNQEVIRALRKELGLTFNDYYMVLTDFDMKAKQEYEVPIAMKAVFDYIDTFSSRISEMEQQEKQGETCKKEDKSRSLENFLSRFRWRRRLFIISTPSDEEWAYQQQLYSLTNQACNLGLRHMSVLKLLEKEMELMGGVLELYPINGSSTIEREDLPATLVQDIRNYFQVSPEYFSMLLVGKDGNIKSWYPSPMWSMSTIYDLVDSMQLRRQEMAIQQSLGMRCPDDDYGHHEQDHDGYNHRGYGY